MKELLQGLKDLTLSLPSELLSKYDLRDEIIKLKEICNNKDTPI